jgi:hypothetical protein
MPTGLTFTSYQTQLVTEIPSVAENLDFLLLLAGSIDYAELSIYRDLDFLALHGDVSLGSATIGTNVIAVPSSVIIVEELYYGASHAPIAPASQAAIRAIYAGGANGPPQYFAMVGGASGATWAPSMTVLLGPAPDQSYAMTAYAVERQAPLSASNPTTFISTQLPDLFWAACMIFWAEYMRSGPGRSADPQAELSWQNEYQRILKGADREEMRKKFQSNSWQAQNPAPLAAIER